MKTEVLNIKRNDLAPYVIEQFPGTAQHLSCGESDAVVFVALQKNIPCGLAVLKPSGSRLNVDYLYVLSQNVRRGVAIELLNAASCFAYDMQKDLQFTYLQSMEYGTIYERLMDRAGFQKEHSVTELCFVPGGPSSEQCWNDFLQRVQPILERLYKRGYSLASFHDAVNDGAIMDKNLAFRLKEKTARGFAPGHYSMKPDIISEDWSFISYRGDKPVAFLTASISGSVLVVDQVRCHDGYKNTGAVLLPLYGFSTRVMDTYRKNPSAVKAVRAAVYDGSGNMANILNGLLGCMMSEQKQREIYVKRY